jgi:hypothetical protein
MFCGEIVELGENEPICIESYPYTHPDVRLLTVAHRACFRRFSRDGVPEWWFKDSE